MNEFDRLHGAKTIQGLSEVTENMSNLQEHT